MTIQNYNVYEGLTAARLVSTVNIIGQYNNGILNNGVDSFLIIPSNTFSIDMEEVQLGDSLLLVNQTNQNENGIYICIQTGGIYSFSIIQRRPDFHSIEQIRAGQTLSIQDGILHKGATYTVVTPIPNKLGIDDLTIICTSPSYKNLDITVSDLTGLENENNLIIFSGLKTTFELPINITDPINHQIITSTDRIILNGITSGLVVGNSSLISSSGTLTSNAFLLGSGTDINLENAIVDGATVVGNLINIQGIGTPTDISNVIPEFIINSSGLILNSFKKYSGDANYFFTSDGASSYVTTAGTGVGQAGDATGCKAQKVLKLNINGADEFIPLFNTN